MVLIAFVLVLSLTLSWAFPLVFAAVQNVTIDDTHGDPVTGAQFTYTPANTWSAQPGCSVCEAHPDASDAYDGTWHDTTFLSSTSAPMNASISFTGSAVYVYCIISNSDANPDGNSDLWFVIDGDMVGSFSRVPPGGSAFLYNYNVYANDQLPMGAHTLTVINGQTNGLTSLILLDYVVYTTGSEEQSPTVAPGTTSSVPTVSAIVKTETIIVVPSSDGAPSTKTVPIISVIHASTVVETEDATITTVSGGSTGVSVVHTLITETSVVGPSNTAAGNTTTFTTNDSGEVVTTLIAANSSPAPSTSSTADITSPARAAGGLDALTRTIAIVVSVVGGILLSVTAAGIILWRRRRHAEPGPRDFKELPSSQTPKTGQSDDWPEDRFTTLSGTPRASHLRRPERNVSTDRPTSMASVQECRSGHNHSRITAASSRNQTPRGVLDDNGDFREADSPTTSDSVVELFTNRQRSKPNSRLQPLDTFYDSYSEYPSQDYSEDATSDAPPSERSWRASTTAATYGGAVTAPTMANDSTVASSPSVPHIPVQSDNAKLLADFRGRRRDRGGGMAIRPVPVEGGARTTGVNPDQREDRDSNERSRRYGFIREVTPPPSYRSASPDSTY